MLDKGPLNGMEFLSPKSLNGQDLPFVCLNRQDQAAIDRAVIQKYRACPTVSFPAPLLCAR